MTPLSPSPRSIPVDLAMASLDLDHPKPPQALHSNWVVQKFGGTSVGKFALNIIEQVVQYDF